MLRLQIAGKMMCSDFISKYFARTGLIFCVLYAILVIFAATSNCVAQDEEKDNSAEAVAFFNEGQNAHEKGNLSAALELYKKALGIVPEFPEAELQSGNAYLSLGRIDEAEKSFRRAVEHREDWTLALASLGSVLVTTGQNSEAEKILLRAVALDELNFPAYSALTELRLNTKAKPEVLGELLKKIKILTGKAKPTASIWAAQAALENTLGDKKSAKISIEKSLELDPANRAALAEKANMALDDGDTTKADAAVKALEAIVPNSSNVKVLRSRVLLALGDADAAVKTLNSIENPQANLLTFRDNIVVNNSTSAVVLEKQLENEPANIIILGRLCSLLRLENPAKALGFCRRASEADPKNIDHAIGYGSALVQAKSYIDAVALFRRLLTIAPENSTIHANLATALFQLKRFEEAKSEYRWIVEKQPTLPAAYYFLAITHDRLGEYLDALANYQEFLRIADAEKNKLEIEKVNLRLPGLQKQLKNGKGKRNE
ncbi:MAG: tetratricopeptide repeat protein [Pyrinomonadaceae bacterium]